MQKFEPGNRELTILWFFWETNYGILEIFGSDQLRMTQNFWSRYKHWVKLYNDVRKNIWKMHGSISFGKLTTD